MTFLDTVLEQFKNPVSFQRQPLVPPATAFTDLVSSARNVLTGLWSGFGGGGPGQSTPTTGSINTSPTASSRGTSPLGRLVPDLSKADPDKLRQLGISDLVYSVPAGGYISNKEASNANSWQSKFGAGRGGESAANSRAAAYYDYINSLPKVAAGTPALNQLLSNRQTAPNQSNNRFRWSW